MSSSAATPSLGAPVVDILGVNVSATGMEKTIRTIEAWIAQRHSRYVCVSGMHGVIECQRDRRLQEIHNAAGLVTPDGISLVWLCKLRGCREVERVYGPDLMRALCDRSPAKGYRHFFYGASPAVLEALVARLTRDCPGLQVVGTCAPPYRALTSEEDAQMVREISESLADVVWVGLGTPKQERWMAEHVALLGSQVLIGVGAAFDFLSGTKRQAPRWMQRNGLEWLFRLLSEPRRLWRRYLVGIPLFAWYLVLDAVGLRGRPPRVG